MGKNHAIRLTRGERRQLQGVSKSKAETARTRVRAMVILLTDAGRSGEEIAHILGITRRTVSSTRTRWRRQGSQGLKDAAHTGRPPLADDAYLRRMKQVVRQDPRDLGYAFSRWTAPRLVEYLYWKTGVRVTPGWLGQLLRMYGFVWRKTKRTIRNLQDKPTTERARKRLLRLKKGLCGQTPTTSFGTATG